MADDNLYAYDELKSMEAVILQDFIDMNTVNISDILDVCDFNGAAAGQSFFGSASTMTVAYIGINRDASGVAEVKTGNTASCGRAVKLVRNGRMLIETPQGVFSASGARVR